MRVAQGHPRDHWRFWVTDSPKLVGIRGCNLSARPLYSFCPYRHVVGTSRSPFGLSQRSPLMWSAGEKNDATYKKGTLRSAVP